MMTTTTSRKFDLGDILSVTTGRLVSRRGVDALYDILNFMTGDDLLTHQLPRAMDECAPEVLRQHPDLTAATAPMEFVDEQHVWQWLAEQIGRFGQDRELTPLPDGGHARIDPITELRMMAPDVPIVAVVVNPGADAD